MYFILDRNGIIIANKKLVLKNNENSFIIVSKTKVLSYNTIMLKIEN